ncbi:MAG: IS66 family transposase [Steroidobacteraceae bacterium]
MDNTATLPSDVPTLHLMLREQQLIESLKANLHRLLKWRFGPKSEGVDVDQFGLFADGSIVVEVPPVERDEARQSASSTVPAERRRAVRVLKHLPRVIEQIDVPEGEKSCPCCGERMSPFGHESSEQLHYIPAKLEVHETRRLKYSCPSCHGAVVRAPVPVLPPIPKSMASASLLAYLIVSKFADGLPLYRIAGRLARLGIDLSHTLMSEWLVQCSELLEELHRRMTAKVLASGHVYTDDTTLPLQNHDPARRKTYEAKLWVYAKDHRHGPPLIVYEFSKSRTRDAPLTFLKDYRGFLQADAYPGYDPLYLNGKITEVACNVHARRRFVEAADLLKTPGRPHEALAFYKELFRIERQIKDLSDEGRLQARQERTVPLLARFKVWLDNTVHSVLPKDSLGEAVHYALRHWSALTKFTAAGHLDPSNNYAERLMRSVAVGRKAFLFVGSERAGHAAAIYYSLVESCKANKVNPLTYLTCVLSNARNRVLVLPTPDEFAAVSAAPAGGYAL